MIAALSTTIKLALGATLSFLIVHLMTVFGLFIAVAYPLWWFFAPTLTICVSCRSRKVGDWCPLCQKTIDNSASRNAPKSLVSAIANGMIILFLTFGSVGLVYAEGLLLSKLGFSPIKKTAAFTIPAKGQYRLGEIFPMKIEITGMNVPVNAVQADIGYDSSKLEIVDITTDGSFANVFIQKEINNDAGYARLTGGLPNHGYLKETGLFGTIYFKAKAPGLVKVEFLPSSLVLANDGNGSNILRTLSSTSYLILSEPISASEEQLFTEQFKAKTPIGSAVLGDSSDKTKLILYQEDDVLGAETDVEPIKPKKQSIFAKVLAGLENFDSIIIENWQKLIRR